MVDPAILDAQKRWEEIQRINKLAAFPGFGGLTSEARLAAKQEEEKKRRERERKQQEELKKINKLVAFLGFGGMTSYRKAEAQQERQDAFRKLGWLTRDEFDTIATGKDILALGYGPITDDLAYDYTNPQGQLTEQLKAMADAVIATDGYSGYLNMNPVEERYAAERASQIQSDQAILKLEREALNSVFRQSQLADASGLERLGITNKELNERITAIDRAMQSNSIAAAQYEKERFRAQDAQKLKPYLDIQNTAGFDLLSRPAPDRTGDELYDFINNIDNYQEEYYFEKGSSYMSTPEGGYKVIPQGYNVLYTFMNQTEVSVYNALHHTNEAEALDYLEVLRPYLEDRQAKWVVQDWEQLAGREPVGASIMSVPLKMIGGMASLMDLGMQAFSGKPMDFNSPVQVVSQSGDVIRSKVTEGIDSEFGKKVYNGVASGVDSVAALAVGGGGWVSAVMLASGAVGNTARSVAARGGTDTQAMMSGIVAGAFEILFEKVSLGNLSALKNTTITGTKSIVWNVLKSMGVNVTDEVLTDIANYAYDYLANGNVSEWETSIKAYISEGLTEEQAKVRTASDLGQRLIETAQVAALSGGATSSTFIAANNVMNQFNRWSERRSQHNSGVNTQMPIFTYDKTRGDDGGFRAYAEEIGQRSDMSLYGKVKAIQTAFETMPNKTDVTIPLDAKYVLGFDDRGNVRYNWPENLGFEERSIVAVSRNNPLPQNWDRVGSMMGSTFSTMKPDGSRYNNLERAVPYAENPRAYHAGMFNSEVYFDVIDAVKAGDRAMLNHILETDAGVEGLTRAEFERIYSTYNKKVADIASQISSVGNLDMTYGLMGNAAVMMDLPGGAPQFTLPLDGETLEILGVLSYK